MEAHSIERCRVDNSTDIATNKQDCEQSLECQIKQSIMQSIFQSIKQSTYRPVCTFHGNDSSRNEFCRSERSVDRSLRRSLVCLIGFRILQLFDRSFDCSDGRRVYHNEPACDSVTETRRAGQQDHRWVAA